MEFNIPEFLKSMLEKQYGIEMTKKIVQGYCERRHTTLRTNTLKSKVDEIEMVLIKEKIEYEKVEWTQEAFILKNALEKEIKALDIYKDGKIYLQSLSSMLPPIILQPQQGMDILDMTAAPGGKTTQIAAITKNKASITACEMNKIRAERLKYNIEKQGANVYVIIQDARKIDNFFSFDQILLDAPCSGSGTINLQKSSTKETFTMRLIEKSVAIQEALLEKAINVLKPGKEMIYSTCSILSCENEEILNKVIKKKKIEILPIEFNGKEKLPLLPTKIKGTLCVCPNQLYEGFFLAKIRKLN
ncbi:RsmB/NOP family class I SAM-dependent RNA methyltransferase [uncultured Clostridium sp.]|uniref:RsmB/NOP family class I SAM-dependent RNA methyltransferase n=1 Tax=uncultured Clostridium sp. TaxID=59620 RepID=UPI002626921F|nr:RsmB/NOP family class I SAM-dependent RNA methyltransferase [uncultured Clostridium sp.]